jgi:uncharacterized membrane protein
MLVTWPLIMLVTGFGWLEAIAADLGLTLAYAIYSYFFHLAFDKLRPVQADTALAIEAGQPALR